MNFDELKGRQVVSLADAQKLGYVETALIDVHSQTVVGLRVRTGGVFTHHHAMLLSDIRSFGEDALTVEDARHLADEGKMPQLKTSVPLGTILGSRIMNEQGTELGTIDDVDFNPETGQIENYILSGNFLDRLRKDEHTMPSSAVKSIGDKIIVVVNETVVT